MPYYFLLDLTVGLGMFFFFFAIVITSAATCDAAFRPSDPTSVNFHFISVDVSRLSGVSVVHSLLPRDADA